jgi:hypothetical protein
LEDARSHYLGPALDSNDSKFGVKPSKVARIARDDRMAGHLRAYHNVSTGDIRRPRPHQQYADGLSVRPVQWDHFRSVMLDHPPKAYLIGRIPNDLRESSGRHDDTVPVLQNRSQNGEDSAVISFQRNQAVRVEGNSVHAAFGGLDPRLRGDSIFLAQARSFGVSGPVGDPNASSRNGEHGYA